MYNGYGNSSNFSIQDYAPVDPLSGIPGFAPQQVQAPNAPQGGQQPNTSNRQQNPNPPVASPAANRSQSATARFANQVQPDVGRRQPTTDELRRDIERAPVYIPTPINGTSTNSDSSAPQANRQLMAPRNNGPPGSVNDYLRDVNQRNMHFVLNNMPFLQNNALRTQQHSQQIQNGQQQTNSDVRRQENSAQRGRQQNIQHVPNVPGHANGPPPNHQRMMIPNLNPPYGPEVEQVQTQPDIRFFRHGDHRFNTYAIVNTGLIPMIELVNAVDSGNLQLNESAALALRVRLHPEHYSYVVPQAFGTHIQEMERKRTGGALPTNPQPQGSSQAVQMPSGNSIAPQGRLECLAPVPPQTSRQQNMPIQQIVPQGISRCPPPGIPLNDPPGAPPQMVPHFQRQQQQQHSRNLSGLTPEEQQRRQQIWVQQQQLHRQQQHQHQQLLQNQQQPTMLPSQAASQNNNPTHALQPQRQPERQQQAPSQSQSLPSVQSNNSAQQASNQPTTDQIQPVRQTDETLSLGIRTNIAADEDPPPCPYTPVSNSPEHFDPEETIDLKPKIASGKKNKKKPIPEIVTLDDDDEPPRNSNIKQEVADDRITSSSGAASDEPSTSGIVNIKRETVDDTTNSRNDRRRESAEQQHQQATEHSRSIKQEPTNNTNSSDSTQQNDKGRVSTLEENALKQLELKTEEERLRKLSKELEERESAMNREKSRMNEEKAAMDREKSQMAEEKAEIKLKQLELAQKKVEVDELNVQLLRSQLELDQKQIQLNNTVAEIERQKKEISEMKLERKSRKEIEQTEQKVTVQESHVSTSQSHPTVQNSLSRSSSIGSDIIPLRQKRRVDDSYYAEDDDEKSNDSSRRKASVKNKKLSTKKRHVGRDDSDDEMPAPQKKKRGIRESGDEHEEWHWEPDHDVSEHHDYIRDDLRGEDRSSMSDFDDDDEIIDENDEFIREIERDIERINSREEKKQKKGETPTRKDRESSPKQYAIRSKTNQHSVDLKRLTEPTPSTSQIQMTDEQKREARRRKTNKTKEENREKARLAKLNQLNGVEYSVSTRNRQQSGVETLNNALNMTISIFNAGKKLQNNSHDTQRKDQRKEQPGSINKRPAASVSEYQDDGDGVHVPAKRMAHSNSSPGPSNPRQMVNSSTGYRNRLNQNQMLEKRYQENEAKKKRDQNEYTSLKSKKFPTHEEASRIRELEISLRINQRPSSTSSSAPSTSVNLRKITIKKEVCSSPVKKIPPPKLIEPSRGTFLDSREHAVKRIHEIYLEQGVPDAAQKAREKEFEFIQKYNNRDKYRMKIGHEINKLQKESASGVLLVNKNAVSHEQILAGGTKENCTVMKGRRVHVQHRQMTIEQLHQLLVPLKLTDAELEKEAYPLFKSNSKNVTIAETQYTLNKKVFLKDYDLERTCSRCNKEFRVKPGGSMIREKDICRYHNRGVAKDGKRDTFRKRYNCCNEEFNVAPGCKFNDVHVFDQLFEKELSRFFATPPPTSPNDPRSINVYAIDCEMVYTVSGPALARFSMVDMQGKQVLDVLVKPPTEVIDPNTEFSGLTMDQVAKAEDTLKSCHEKLFQLVNSETILIGHSLESDLKAMRIVHKSVIDTAILFRSPGDFKIALKNLSAKLLNRTIQGDNEDAVGHDSLEDARTCVDLIYYGLKNPESLVFRK